MDRGVTEEVRVGRSVMGPKGTRLPQLTEGSGGAQGSQDGGGLRQMRPPLLSQCPPEFPRLSLPGMTSPQDGSGTGQCSEPAEPGLPLWHPANLSHKHQADYKCCHQGVYESRAPGLRGFYRVWLLAGSAPSRTGHTQGLNPSAEALGTRERAARGQGLPAVAPRPGTSTTSEAPSMGLVMEEA